MRLLHLSDIHGRLSVVRRIVRSLLSEDFDLVVVSGDVTDYGHYEEALTILESLTELAPVVFVHGNCDFDDVLEISRDNVICAHRRKLSVKGLVIAGVGGSTITPFATPSEYPEEVLSRWLDAIEPPVHVLLTHVPPKGTPLAVTMTGIDAGSEAVRRAVERLQPAVCCCGHIHEARGTARLGATVIVNPGPAAGGYFAVIELDSEVNVELRRVSMR